MPFLLEGGLAEARGIGEELRFLKPRRLFFVLLNPGLPVSTRAVYQALAPEDYGPPLRVEAILEALEAGRAPPWRNDLEGAAFRLYPELGRLKAELVELGLFPLLSGSGATFLVPAPSGAEAERIAGLLKERYPGAWIRAVRTA